MLYPVNDEWRAEVRAALQTRGWDQTDLARAVGTSHAAISMLLSGKSAQSRWIPKIHEVLGFPPTTKRPVVSDMQHRWNELFSRITTDEGRQKMLEVAEMMIRGIGPKG